MFPTLVFQVNKKTLEEIAEDRHIFGTKTLDTRPLMGYDKGASNEVGRRSSAVEQRFRKP